MYGQAGSYMTAMDPNKAPSNIQWANAYLGASTSLEPGKAMKDFLSLPASGIENVELSVIDPQKFESIPREMFSEARRLGKLLIHDFTKDGRPTPISVHAPMMEATGFAENKFDENQWRATQQHLNSIVEKAALVGPNVPLNIHASQLPADQNLYNPKKAGEMLKELERYEQVAGGKDQELRNYLSQGIIPQMMIAVDPVSGQLTAVQGEFREPAPGLRHFWSPQDKLNNQNRTQWDEMKRHIFDYFAERQRTEDLMKTPGMLPQDIDVLKKRYASYDQDFSSATFTTLDHVYRADPGVFTEDEKKTIKQAYLEQDAAKVAKILGSIGTRERPKPPRLLIPAEEFTLPKAAETFASAAMRSYDISSNPEKFLSKEDAKDIRAAGIMGVAQAPIITIENETDRAFARGDSLRLLVDKSRKMFEDKLVAEKHIPQQKAKEISEQIIGATWDVGHINLMKRYGYNEEQIAAEIKKIKDVVKHVHIHDNFGSFDAHLAPGMGNVPIQAILKELQTEGKMPKGVRGIVEAGGYVMNFGENPTLKTLEYFRAPAYGFQGAPSWGGESPMAGGYFMGSSAYSAGYGLMLPPIHYSEYGAGFTGLPPSLAAVPGTAQRSQFAGTPNA
jgi:hypothetical protein